MTTSRYKVTKAVSFSMVAAKAAMGAPKAMPVRIPEGSAKTAHPEWTVANSAITAR